MDDSKKVKIFTNNPGAIKSVSVSLPKKSTDKVNIIIDAKTADIIPQAFKDIFDYINNLPEIKGEIARIQAETDLKTGKLIEEIDFKLPRLIEARKANLIYLNQITDMLKKKQLMYLNVNPADLIKEDIDLTLEIINLQQAKIEYDEEKGIKCKSDSRNIRPTLDYQATFKFTDKTDNYNYRPSKPFHRHICCFLS
ncbi:MAG: hypothetical protein Q7J15_08575 [Candidatus Desulfaltia sp.]|nr:hypothetical protein [Candidatus Desulfaltia sp.]